MQAYMFQITTDGVWEEALQLDISEHDEEEIAKLEAFFSLVKTDDVAFEVFFKDAKNKISFFGMRIQGLQLHSKRRATRELLAFLFLNKDYPLILTKVEMFFETQITDKNPDFKEIGFEGFWKSRGSTIVQQDGLKLSLDELLADNPQFNKKFDDRYIMMEFAWKVNESRRFPYWIAHQLSNKKGKIDKEVYNTLIGV